MGFEKISRPPLSSKLLTNEMQISFPNIESIVVNPNLASEFHKRLVGMVNDFDNALDETEEVGMRLVSFGQTIQFHVEDIGYSNPSLITFRGKTGEGKDIELIQHVTQISFLLMAVPRLNPEEPKKKIGFSSEE